MGEPVPGRIGGGVLQAEGTAQIDNAKAPRQKLGNERQGNFMGSSEKDPLSTARTQLVQAPRRDRQSDPIPKSWSDLSVWLTRAL